MKALLSFFKIVVVQNILSIDVEDYFHVEAFSSVVPRSDWDKYSSRVEDNMRRLLDIMDDAGVKSTCFILGWVAEHHPALVREIVDRGHEPACHSYWHRLIYKLHPEEFRADTLRAKDTIEQACGVPVRGYRAPSYSVTAKSMWGLEILAETGFTYDSSIFPVHHDTYGIPKAPRVPFRVDTPSGPLIEFPISTFKFFGQNMPVGGGGYLRVLPPWYTSFGLSRLRPESIPLIVYLHPWEIDPEQPRIQAGWKSRLRHYTNLASMESRFRRLLKDYGPFCTFRDSSLEPSPGLAIMSSTESFA